MITYDINVTAKVRRGHRITVKIEGKDASKMKVILHDHAHSLEDELTLLTLAGKDKDSYGGKTWHGFSCRCFEVACLLAKRGWVTRIVKLKGDPTKERTSYVGLPKKFTALNNLRWAVKKIDRYGMSAHVVIRDAE